jgi:hypothetical protein
MSLINIVIIFFLLPLGLLRCLIPSGFQIKIVRAQVLIAPMSAAVTAHLIVLDLINLIIIYLMKKYGKKRKLEKKHERMK